MKKTLTILFLSSIFCNIGLAESYYFKECKLSETYSANYLIDLKKNMVTVNFYGGDSIQEKKYKIELVTKDQIVTEKKQNVKHKEYYFQYYLDSNTGSVLRQKFKKKNENDIFRADGLTQKYYCNNVKANWNQTYKKKQSSKKQKQNLETESSLPKCQKSDYKQWTNCQGSRTSQNSYKYSGIYKEGKILKGTAIFPGGGKYVGEFKSDLPHGYGTFTFTDGSQYFGEWQDGKGDGQGIKTWNDGRKYTGTFKSDIPHGRGTFNYPDGSKYVGEYKNGKRHGQGTLKYSNGETYIGQFVDGSEYDNKDISSSEESNQNISDIVKDCSKLKKFSHKWNMCKLGRLN